MSQKTLPWPLLVNQGFYIPKRLLSCVDFKNGSCHFFFSLSRSRSKIKGHGFRIYEITYYCGVFFFSVSYECQWQLLVPSNFYPTPFVYRVKSPWFYSPAALSPLIIGPVILEPQVKGLDTYKTWTSLAIYFAADNDTSIRHDMVVYLAIFPLARPRFTLIMY